MRSLVGEGTLGGGPLHIESYYCYDLSEPGYAKALLGDKKHWVRRLPGRLLHNIISHGIARIAEFLTTDSPTVIATGHQSAQLRALGGQEVLDELRVLIRDKNGMTALFSFSTQIKPALNQFRLLGPVNSITVDLTSGSILRQKSGSYKSYLTFLVLPLKASREYLANFRRNAFGILRQRLHQDSGMKELIERFYASLAGGAPPISPREILLTARLMDAVFAQIRAEKPTAPPSLTQVGR